MIGGRVRAAMEENRRNREADKQKGTKRAGGRVTVWREKGEGR